MHENNEKHVCTNSPVVESPIEKIPWLHVITNLNAYESLGRNLLHLCRLTYLRSLLYLYVKCFPVRKLQSTQSQNPVIQGRTWNDELHKLICNKLILGFWSQSSWLEKSGLVIGAVASVAVLAEVLLRSPRKLFILIIKKHIYTTKLSKIIMI